MTVEEIHQLTAVHRGDAIRAQFQNTPAQLHGRPQEVEQMMNDLRASLPK